MNAFAELRNAAIGWIGMLTAQPDAGRHFNVQAGGLVNAIGFYFVVVVLVVLGQAVLRDGTLPNYSDAFVAILANALPLAGVAAAAWGTWALLQLDVPLNALIVPAAYAVGFAIIVGQFLAIAGGALVANVVIGVLAYMLFRLGRDMGKMTVGISIAFAALGIVALVALPAALYMLTVPAAPAA